MDFNDIVGHQRIIKNLQKAIERGHLSHCYLFEGEGSLGKKKVALAFAKPYSARKKTLLLAIDVNLV